LKKNLLKNSVWYIVFIVILFVSVKQCEEYNSKKFRKKIDLLESKNDSLIKQNDSIAYILLEIKKQVSKQEQISDSLRNKITRNKEKQNEVLIDVLDYDERELDSILSNHRHIKRTEN
jgi:cytochrome c biogenesis protein ResB